MELNKKEKVEINYTNYRGESSKREIIPLKIWFGSTEWHPENGWLLDAYDLDKKANRSFSIQDIEKWSENN